MIETLSNYTQDNSINKLYFLQAFNAFNLLARSEELLEDNVIFNWLSSFKIIFFKEISNLK